MSLITFHLLLALIATVRVLFSALRLSYVTTQKKKEDMDDKSDVIIHRSRSDSEKQPGKPNKGIQSEALNENDANDSDDKIVSCEENTDKNCANSRIGNGYTYDNNHNGDINVSFVSDSNDSATNFTKIPEENVNNSNHYSVISNPVSDDNDVNTESGDVSTNNDDVYSKAPDGGWGWLVVLASFLLHAIVDGVSFSMGIFYVVFLDTFQETKSNTSWIGSILTAAMHLIALPAGMMCERFGYRVVSISGSVIATVGFVLSAFAPSIYVLYVTLGAVVGVGFGLMFFPSVVCVQLYFDKKRSLAMGISVCGTGVGTFALAPFVRWLTDTISWKYTMGVLAGITLTGSSLGMLYKPLRKREADEKADVMEIPEGKETELEDNELSFGTKMVHLNENQESKVGNLTTSFTKKTEDNSLKSTNIFTGLKQEVPEQSISIENERMEHKQMAKIHAEENTAPSIDHTLSSALKENSSACCAKCSIDGAVGAIHWSLLRDPAFVVWLSCYFICQLGIIIPFTFIPDSAISRNIGAPEAAFLISIIGIVNTVTRLVTGIVADRKFIRYHRLQLLAFSVFIGGVALIVNPFCNTYATLAVDVVFTGISLGSFILLMPVVLRDLFGLDKMNSSIGFTLVIVGISTMLVPFLGWLTDVTGSYDITFYVTGGALVICSFVQAMLRSFQKKTYHPECNVPEMTEDTRL